MAGVHRTTPVDFDDVILADLSSIVVTLSGPGLVALFDALLAIKMSAGKYDFVFILVARPTLHLGQPVMELQVHILLIEGLVQL